MGRGYPIYLAVFTMLGVSPLFAQNMTPNENVPQHLSFADSLDRYEHKIGFDGQDPVEPLTRLAAHRFLGQRFEEADKALDLVRDAVRIDEGLFTRSQIPFLIMQAENFSNQANWSETRKLQNHLVWLFQSRFSVPDKYTIGELRAMSRLHMRGVGLDGEAWRAYHYIRALHANRLALDVADALWPASDVRKAGMIHEQLRILHLRATEAMAGGLLFPASPDSERFAGSFVLNLSEKLNLGEMREAGDRYLAQFGRLFAGNSSAELEQRGIVKLYEADWQLLFDKEANVSNIYDESRILFEQAGISQTEVDELIGRTALLPGTQYPASVSQLLSAWSSGANTNANSPETVSFASLKLHPFAELVFDEFNLSASVAPE